MISDHALFSSYEGQQGAANGQDSCFFFRDAQGFGRLDAGSRAGFTSSRSPPPSWTSIFQFSFFLYDVCVRVVVPFIDLWTHQPASHRRKVTQDFSAFLLRCLP